MLMVNSAWLLQVRHCKVLQSADKIWEGIYFCHTHTPCPIYTVLFVGVWGRGKNTFEHLIAELEVSWVGNWLGNGGLLGEVSWSLVGLVWLIWFVVLSLLFGFCWFRFVGSHLQS